MDTRTVIDHLEECDVGPRVIVELLQHLLSELNSNLPILLLGQYLQDAEVHSLTDIGLNGLANSPWEVSKQLLSV